MAYKKGFTIIELVMVMLVLGIIAVVGADQMLRFIQNSVFIPNKLNVDMIGQEILDLMIEGYQAEGYARAKGLRFSTSITAAGPSSVAFTNTDAQAVAFSWSSADKKIYRSVNAGANQVIPYYLPSGISIEQKGSIPIFTYYTAEEGGTTSTAADVRRVKIEFRARSGSGSYDDWQGELDFASGIAVRKFQ